jgi:hypothetical protein
VSGASDMLDPVGVAQDDIDRSKHLIASTLDELTRHHSWLESYHRDERRRAQRLRRQEALDRLELRRQRAAWLLRRFTVTALAAMRSTAIVLAQTAVAFWRAAREFTLAAAAWTAPRAHALAAQLIRSLAASWSWFRRTALYLARTGFAGAAAGFAWTVQASERLGVALRKHLSAGFARTTAQAAVLTHPVRKRASAEWLRARHRSRRFTALGEARLASYWSWARAATPILARRVVRRTAAKGATLSARLHNDMTAVGVWAHTQFRALMRAAAETVADGWSRWRSWAERQAARLSAAYDSWRTPDRRHRALVVRRCTALVLIEPWRPRLPAVHGG